MCRPPGYGHISPSSVGGKIACVFFAMFGIPLFLVAAAALGDKLQKGLKKLEERLRCDCCDRAPKCARVARLTAVFLLGFVLLMVIPAVIFYVMEEWTYMDAMYYCYITLTTIGFGDLVPGKLARSY